MTGAVLDRPQAQSTHRPSPDDGGATLEERLTAALHATLVNGSTECPVCAGRMTPVPGVAAAGATAAGANAADRTAAECDGCGARLATAAALA
jgi:hypothetical protein